MTKSTENKRRVKELAAENIALRRDLWAARHTVEGLRRDLTISEDLRQRGVAWGRRIER